MLVIVVENEQWDFTRALAQEDKKKEKENLD